jgi:hypothetical protein
MPEIDCNEPSAVRVGMRTVLKILEKWSCNQRQVQNVLQLPENYESLDFEQMSFSREQVERASYILNIHAGLRSTFTNSDNVYGFMNMVNNNNPFNGLKPIDFICNGEIEKFKLLQEHIDWLFKEQ